MRTRMNWMPGWSAHLVMAAIGMALCVGVACDDGPPPPGPNELKTATGKVYKGSAAGSEVSLYNFSSSGGKGALYAGPFTTNASGEWTGEIEAPANPLLVVATGGEYTDESTGETVGIGSDFYGILRTSTLHGNVTPVSHAMVLNIRERVARGTGLSTAINAVIGAAQTGFGFDVTSSAPAEDNVHGVFLAGFSHLLATDPALSPTFDNALAWDLVVGLIADLSDGKLDGLDAAGDDVLVDPDGPGGSGPVAWPQLDSAGVGAIVDAANAWAASNSVGITVPDVDLSGFTFGGGDVDGTLNVSGTDAGTFGSSFTPTESIIEMGTEGGIGFMSPGTLQFVYVQLPQFNLSFPAVVAQKFDLFWGSTELPEPGVVVTPVSGGYKVTFSNVNLASDGGGTLILNGTLTALTN